MHFIAAISVLIFLLLGACADPQSLAVITIESSLHQSESNQLRTQQRHYTNHPTAVGKLESVLVRIDGQFTDHQRADILQAVNDWNYVLNGFVRLEVAQGPPEIGATATTNAKEEVAKTWTIVSTRGDTAYDARAYALQETLAVTQPIPGSGGLVIVFADRLGTRDLSGIMRHELGHMLGLAHAPSGGYLMSRHYSTQDQQCIDRSAAESIATSHKLALIDLNWCE